MEEKEEGELSDGELSDISSGEEYLLRQRLQVLENYNHVLERKEAKRKLSEYSQKSKHFEIPHGKQKSQNRVLQLPYLSELSCSDLENNISINVPNKIRSAVSIRTKDNTCNINRHMKDGLRKRRVTIRKRPDKTASNKRVKLRINEKEPLKKSRHNLESSDDTDDEYRNKRKRLAHSVATNKQKSDHTSLKMRLLNMFGIKSTSDKKNKEEEKIEITNNNEQGESIIAENKTNEPINTLIEDVIDICDIERPKAAIDDVILITDDEVFQTESNEICTQVDTDKLEIETKILDTHDTENHKVESDDDIELLRQNALQTKTQKLAVSEIGHQTDSDDSEELRIICLRSKVLKNKMEWRRKIKLRKKLAKISTLDDTLLLKLHENSEPEKTNSHNNTDIESVDMDIGHSDTDDVLLKELNKDINFNKSEDKKETPEHLLTHTEDLEEDEDLLRTKLLTSLSNNFQKLYQSDKLEPNKKGTCNTPNEKKISSEPKKFIINIGESDSDSENETTENLKLMHKKLAESIDQDFQCKLDLFLKNARTEAEKKEDTTVEKEATTVKALEKFVPKTVNHLPKSRQLEYKRLVKRMAELEKLKSNRQTALDTSTNSKYSDISKLKDVDSKVITISNTNKKISSNLDDEIALSRQKIAAESVKILELKQQSSKLSQKYKMVQSELHNVRTAMSLNKRNIASVQASLLRLRSQHQGLVKRSKGVGQNKSAWGSFGKTFKTTTPPKSDISKNSINNVNKLKSLTVSVVNDLSKKSFQSEILPVQIKPTNNTKHIDPMKCKIEIPKSITDFDLKHTKRKMGQNEIMCTASSTETNVNTKNSSRNVSSESNIYKVAKPEKHAAECELNDYKSPLTSMNTNHMDIYKSNICRWKGDPNGILCPFEVLGACKDRDCTYEHSALRQ